MKINITRLADSSMGEGARFYVAQGSTSVKVYFASSSRLVADGFSPAWFDTLATNGTLVRACRKLKVGESTEVEC